MSLWIWLLIACALAYAWKLVGYFVPARLLEDPRMSRVAGTMTIGLLASRDMRGSSSNRAGTK